MVSPLAKQRRALIAKQQPKSASTQVVDESTSLHLLTLELEADYRVLKAFNRIDDKVQHKRDVLIPKFKPHVESYLASNAQYPNPLFAQLVVWLFDIDDLETAIDWCLKAIERELDTPERMKRDFATFCADEVLQWAEKMSAQGHSIEPYFSQVFAKVRDEWRLNEKVTAKWFKFAGLYLLRDEEGKPRATAVGSIETLENAYALLEQAHAQNINAGVTSMMDKIKARIRAIEDGRL